MRIFKENKAVGLVCGINDFGELFLEGRGSGYNLPDSKKNRARILKDFDFYNSDDDYYSDDYEGV